MIEEIQALKDENLALKSKLKTFESGTVEDGFFDDVCINKKRTEYKID